MQSIAKYQEVCDHCNTILSQNYASIKTYPDQLSLGLSVEDENYPGSKYHRTHHFCDEGCLAKHLANRAKGNGKKISKASMLFSDASVEVDITASKGYTKPKEV